MEITSDQTVPSIPGRLNGFFDLDQIGEKDFAYRGYLGIWSRIFVVRQKRTALMAALRGFVLIWMILSI